MKTLTLLGGMSTPLGVAGVGKAVNELGLPMTEPEDLTAVGPIANVEGTAIKHRLTNAKLSPDYSLSYSFVPADGKQYSGSCTIDETKSHSLSKGQDIEEVYAAESPFRRHATVGYRHFTPVSEREQTPPMTALARRLGSCGFGGLIYAGSFSPSEAKR